MGGFFSMVTPLLLHMVISGAVATLFAQRMDMTSCTALTALLVIPAAGWMYWQDKKKRSCVRDAAKEHAKESEIRAAANRAERKDGTGRRIACGAVCLIAGGVLNLAWSGVLNLLHIQEYFSNATQERLLAAQLAVQIVGLGILVPIAEELVFRGLIYERMKQFFPVKAAVILSALLFAVYHGNPIQMIFAFPMAIVLAAVQEYGKGVTFAILFHVGANLTAVGMNLLFG